MDANYQHPRHMSIRSRSVGSLRNDFHDHITTLTSRSIRYFLGDDQADTISMSDLRKQLLGEIAVSITSQKKWIKEQLLTCLPEEIAKDKQWSDNCLYALVDKLIVGEEFSEADFLPAGWESWGKQTHPKPGSVPPPPPDIPASPCSGDSTTSSAPSAPLRSIVCRRQRTSPPRR